MKLVDTCYLIDLLHNREPALNKLDDLNKDIAIFITSINVFELVVGEFLLKEGNREKRLQNLLKFVSAFEVLELDFDATLKSAEIQADLMLKGKEINTNDSLIAGIALVNKVDTIITKNTSHFDRIKGLKVESY